VPAGAVCAVIGASIGINSVEYQTNLFGDLVIS
jgi:hypothetical protein